ncbi:steroid 17-alpha-hydroxylase/17,20 lyase-like [Ruditapes philippinarum]|uniref:steroid 17-alpha-hydroxylase/17,20 lyase-like n=1 Tax=Ruditapes philippinarum TaxID=129788 RepID=UPI00295A6B8E|nr:steroid 17-alpha-hydroxylase/17,20 lyase-like [Ruditapes philippinarum]
MIQEMLLAGSVWTTSLVAIVTGLAAYWLIQKWRYRYPPGPFALPLIGNMLQIDEKKLHMQAYEWSKKYGPVITVGLGPMTIVFVNTIDTALEVLVKKSNQFASRMTSPSIDVITYGGKDIAFSNYGPAWKLHRKMASKALREFMLGDALENRIFDAVETAFVEIDKVSSGPFNPEEYINFIVTNILTSLCFGGKYDFKDEEVRYILKVEDDMNERFSTGVMEDFIPGLQYVYKTRGFKEVEEFTHHVMEGFLRRKYKEAESTFNKDKMRHFADNLILARMEAEEEEGKEALTGFDEDRIVQTLADIFFAGVDTSRFTLRFALLHMVAFPDIQQKVQEEIDNVVGRDRLPGVADRPNLAYTEAVLHESMRLSSVAPLGIFHQASCDTEVAGFKIPKGTNVGINHWALHHDPNAWNDVDRFIPERYLNEDGKLGPKPKNWLPFSAGTRVCLGEFVAKPQLHLIFASLMQRYKWRMESGMCADITPVGSAFQVACKPHKVIAEKRV